VVVSSSYVGSATNYQSQRVLPVRRRRWRLLPHCRGARQSPHASRYAATLSGSTAWSTATRSGRGTKIRIADIDTPKTHPPRSACKARLAQAATPKMYPLLNAGPFTLTPTKRDVDRYGRKLRLVERDGASLGAVLVRQGLARRYGGGKRSPWC